ncbi:MAG: hypothetical protein SGJ10_02875 [Bacteroidota bacterium]|nr:hypothetical protein [Bacteroidota bacterium]
MNLLINKDNDLVGIMYGIVFPVVCFAVLSLLADYGLKLSEEFSGIICIGTNLVVFYYYINRHLYKSVRGIVIVTIFWAIVYIVRFKFNQ